MADNLAALSLALGLLGSDPSVDPGGWKDYVWKVQMVAPCLTKAACPVLATRWDWKRDQRVEVQAGVAGGKLVVSNRLINRDRTDDDDVCVTALFRDKSGKTIAVFHENRHSNPQTDEKKSTRLDVAKNVIPAIQSIAVGSKQCRGGPHQDDRLYQRTKATLGQK